MDPYSRFVAIFKVLLPLAALAILASLFLLSRSTDPTATIPFATKDAVERIRGQQVTAPFFSGTTPKGEEILVTAAKASPGGPDTPAEATDVQARLRYTDGSWMKLKADTGTVAVRDNRASFRGNVRITSQDGLQVDTDALDTALREVSGSTPGRVTAIGPMGELEAGTMSFGADHEGGPVHMLFKNGVKLIYHPKKTE